MSYCKHKNIMLNLIMFCTLSCIRLDYMLVFSCLPIMLKGNHYLLQFLLMCFLLQYGFWNGVGFQKHTQQFLVFVNYKILSTATFVFAHIAGIYNIIGYGLVYDVLLFAHQQDLHSSPSVSTGEYIDVLSGNYLQALPDFRFESGTVGFLFWVAQ